jgi:DNA-binding NarL/FixJ family response regulator
VVEALQVSVPALAEKRLIVATERTVVQCLLQEARVRSASPFHIEHIALDADAIGAHDPRIEAATAAIIDMGSDPFKAVRFCGALRAQRPSLPISALVCCTQAFTAMHLQHLLQVEGPCSIVDSEATVAELLRAMERLLKGRTSIRLQMSTEFARMLEVLVPKLDVRKGAGGNGGPYARGDLDLIMLVAQGLTDREIGSRLHLSRHTVHHRIERLRAELNLKNRVELAAWAGRQGLYSPDGREHPTLLGWWSAPQAPRT